jgi:hypothetical protein
LVEIISGETTGEIGGFGLEAAAAASFGGAFFEAGAACVGFLLGGAFVGGGGETTSFGVGGGACGSFAHGLLWWSLVDVGGGGLINQIKMAIMIMVLWGRAMLRSEVPRA